ncbi:hypothetical protein [Armatimonas sp.]|uniref:hypothetical protein n=1 Tax=Armatimonas sp. TaxID=1872638 RepID=UPI00286CE4B3|nr:hypothetical protein [Armatimonas sp.]
MKKADASRPGLSLPVRLGVLALITGSGVLGVAAVLAKQNGTDVISSLSTLDFTKAYNKENLNYSLADAKLRFGDRKGAAALVKTLPFTDGEERLSYKELRQKLVGAQIAAQEFTEALRSAQDDQTLQTEVLTAQSQRQGLDATLRNAASLSEPARSTALTRVAVQYAGLGDTENCERLVGQITPTLHGGIFSSLVSAYYKGGKLDAAIGALKRITDKNLQSSALSQLGSSCLLNKDGIGVRRVLEEMPAEASQRQTIKTGTTGTVTTRIIHAQRYQLLQNVTCLSPSETLELIQRYAYPDELPELLRAVCSAARIKQDTKTTQAALALLRLQTSEEGKKAYDQEVQQLFYSNQEPLSTLLPLAQTIHSDQVRSSALQNLGYRTNTADEFKPILALLQKYPDENSRRALANLKARAAGYASPFAVHMRGRL